MADTETVLSTEPIPYTSSFKGLLANLQLFMDHLKSPSRLGLFPALREWTTKEQIIIEFTGIFFKYLITSKQFLINKHEGQPVMRISMLLWQLGNLRVSDHSCRISWWAQSAEQPPWRSVEVEDKAVNIWEMLPCQRQLGQAILFPFYM